MAPVRSLPKTTILALRPVSVRAVCQYPFHRAAAAATSFKLDYDTSAFEKELVDFAGEPEYIVKGGRDKFANLAKAFRGIKEARSRSTFILA
jgi:ketol-acid reductoisomerase